MLVYISCLLDRSTDPKLWSNELVVMDERIQIISPFVTRHLDTEWHIVLPHITHKITESQNGRGWNSAGHPVQPPRPKQGHLQQAAQDLVQAGLEYLQRRRIYNLPGQPVPVLRHPQSEEVLPHVQTELPVPQFVPIAPCPVTGHHWTESGPILLTHTPKILINIS